MLGRRPAGTAPSSFVERVLQAVGGEHAFTDAVLGDLAEERALRMARDGRLRASLWYLYDAIRSVPHLLRNGWQFGGPETRTRLLAIVMGTTFVVSAMVAVIIQQTNPAARIISAYGSSGEGVVINNLSAIQLPMKVMDKHGLPLSAKGVRFHQISGQPVSISGSGVVKCSDVADAMVLATVGTVSTSVALHCRPVQVLRADPWMDFVQGDSPRVVQYAALSPQGTFVSDLRGTMKVDDEGVAVVRDNRIVEPKTVGATPLTIRIGDKTSIVEVTVYQLVPSFENLSRTQTYPAVAVRLALGKPVTHALPRGTFWLKYLPRTANDPSPDISVLGHARCTAGSRSSIPFMRGGEVARYCEVTADDATVTTTLLERDVREIQGSLALDRVAIP